MNVRNLFLAAVSLHAMFSSVKLVFVLPNEV